ncbi:YbaB/EbfC family nucleoid-associated protein [Buchnera aphidicola (Takecallis taiwana)]|uniref:YbaB/EbfC family nucleoid-associated protein n=1 Tax=Buchnera aphidicola TaxID=9 RepID=UPI0031B69BC6
MFDNNNIGDFMKKAQKIQEKMQKIKHDMHTIQVQGESGAGLVKVIMNGQHHCIKIDIDFSLLNPSEKNILEDLITAAFNDANQKINEEKKNKMSSITPGIPIPNDINFMI